MEVDYTYLRPIKADTVRKLHTNIKKTNDIAVETISNGVILPLKRFAEDKLLFGRGGCVTENEQYVDISGIPNRVYGKYEYGKVEKMECTVMYCGYLVRHWGHFLIEAITRLWYVMEIEKKVDYFVFFTEADSEYALQGNYREFFQILGILDRIIIINKPTMFNEIIIPDRAYKRKELYSDKFANFLDYIAENALRNNNCHQVKDFPEKVYLSRNRLFSKNKNENTTEYGLDMLDDFFERNGYCILYPEKLSFCEMVSYLRNADVCASESGSVAHNLMFARCGGTTEIIERQVYPNEFQADIDVIKDFSTTYIDAYFALYPSDAAGGPCLLFYNSLFDEFSKNKQYKEPSSEFLSTKYKKKAIKWYIHSYHVHSGYRLMLHEDMLYYSGEYYETMMATNVFFESCLPRIKKKSEKIHIVRHIPQILLRKVFGDEAVENLKRRIACRKSV